MKNEKVLKGSKVETVQVKKKRIKKNNQLERYGFPPTMTTSSLLYIIFYLLQRNLPDLEKDKQHPSKGNVKKDWLSVHIDEQEAVTLPGCRISPELPTMTSHPSTAQIPRVCQIDTIAMPGVLNMNIFLIFQTVSSAQSNNADKDDKSQIKDSQPPNGNQLQH